MIAGIGEMLPSSEEIGKGADEVTNASSTKLFNSDSSSEKVFGEPLAKPQVKKSAFEPESL